MIVEMELPRTISNPTPFFWWSVKLTDSPESDVLRYGEEKREIYY